MKKQYRWLAAGLICASLLISACEQGSGEASAEEDKQVTIEQLEGPEPTREVLTEDAAQRLDIQTAPVQDGELNGAKRTVIPYAAIIYDTEGATWVYLNPEPLTFVRHP